MQKLSVIFLALLAAPALAVTTSHWTQTNEADFKAGTLRNVVATNLGDVKLSRAVKTLLEEDPKVSMVTALAQGKDGVIYAGTAPQGLLLQINGEKVSTIATIPDAVSITSLLPEADGALLIGVSGATGRVLRIDKPGDKPHEIFSEKDVQYIWGLARLPDGTLYAATGPNGQLFAIHANAMHEEIYKSDENNLTALASDGKDSLYVGTDPNGLIIRVNRKTREAFVLYDADEDGITALALDDQGNLYAATGEAPATDQPPAPPTPPKEHAGRPEPGVSVPLPSQPPTPSKPPAAPLPNPSQPPPIPQKRRAASVGPAGNWVIPVMLVDNIGGADQAADPGIPGLPGEPSPSPEPAMPGKPLPKHGKHAPAPGEAEPPKPQGNAVYKIDPDGFVTEVFREQVVIYSMLVNKGVLLVGTGNDGEIYQVDPAAQETALIAKTDGKQVTAMLVAGGQVYLGLSNTGAIAAMTNGHSASGTFTSPVLDATQVSRYGVIEMHGSLPAGTALTLSTRSGNIRDPAAQGWSQWTKPVAAQEFLPIGSPSARFLQYRITFTTTDPNQTPVINDVDVAYQMPHLPPVIKSIKLTDAQQGAKAENPKPIGTGTQTITWDSSDSNNDSLVYSLYFRSAPGGSWILLKDKLTDMTFAWDTKSVADGRYEIKVVASDALANPRGDAKSASRVSDVVVVDNTPPVIGDLKVSATGKTAHIDLRITDQTSTVANLEYSVDSNDVWQSVLPVDKIFDQPEETVALTVDDLTAGPHQITLRATDAHGNVAFQTVTVTTGPK